MLYKKVVYDEDNDKESSLSESDTLQLDSSDNDSETGDLGNKFNDYGIPQKETFESEMSLQLKFDSIEEEKCQFDSLIKLQKENAQLKSVLHSQHEGNYLLIYSFIIYYKGINPL